MKDSLLVRTLRGERGSRAPVWFMRQAGRYLPEYRALRAKHSMLDLIRNPSLASEVTLQPLRRFTLDAAIIFADILNPLIGMGIELDFVEGEGPKIGNPVRNERDVESLKIPSAKENVPYTLEAIERTCAELGPRGIPLIGFAGAPFTLSYYLMGSRDGNGTSVKRFLLNFPDAWNLLQEKLVSLLAEYLISQVQAGVSVIQVFDSWVGLLSPSEFTWAVLPYLEALVSKLKSETTVPIVYFSTGSAGLYTEFRALNVDGFGVDWRLSLNDSHERLGGKRPLQGNLDPVVLADGPWWYIEKEVKRIIDEGRSLSAPHVFNLGHGILPHTPIEMVEKVIQLVQES